MSATSIEQLTDAYEHLYDIAHLRGHGVGDALAIYTDPGKDRAWQIHRALIKLIDELNPGGRAPAMSREWRKHKLMCMRYVDGLTPQVVADALAISRRQYYRVHDEAMSTLARMLTTTHGNVATLPEPQRADVWRAEMERHAHTSRRASLHDVLDSALALLNERLSQRGVQVSTTIPAALPLLRAEDKLFRQLLLSVLDFLAERSRNAILDVSACAGGDWVETLLCVTPSLQYDTKMASAFDDLAALNGAQVLIQVENGLLQGIGIRQPVLAPLQSQVVLCVDDNDDTLELYRRYLEPQQYLVVGAHNSAEVFETLLDVQPDAIFLDLMLPEQDGWDILQLLKNEPDARDIPVFICSVLRQKELALSLGATGFIEKPFTQAALLVALQNR
jgi:CheY-like chemotaxis protein